MSAICSECFKEIESSNAFCPNCGAKTNLSASTVASKKVATHKFMEDPLFKKIFNIGSFIFWGYLLAATALGLLVVVMLPKVGFSLANDGSVGGLPYFVLLGSIIAILLIVYVYTYLFKRTKFARFILKTYYCVSFIYLFLLAINSIVFFFNTIFARAAYNRLDPYLAQYISLSEIRLSMFGTFVGCLVLGVVLILFIHLIVLRSYREKGVKDIKGEMKRFWREKTYYKNWIKGFKEL